MSRSMRRTSLLLVAGLLGFGCAVVGQLFPTPTPQATPTPSATPTPRFTPTPESIYGIDEPAIIPDIQMSCFSGLPPQKDTAKVTLRGAETVAKITLSEDETAFPESGNTFLTLFTSISIEKGCLDLGAIGSTLTLDCAGEQYSLRFWGIRVLEGGARITFTYEVPQSADISSCEVTLPDGQAIPLEPVLGQR